MGSGRAEYRQERCIGAGGMRPGVGHTRAKLLLYAGSMQAMVVISPDGFQAAHLQAASPFAAT
jgi:hypothetical protein